MAKPKQATNEEILGEHLPYELWMLRETDARLKSPPEDYVLRNALIEAFCIHARQLLEFFDNKQGKHAKDFTGGNYAAAHLSGLTRSERDKLNTQIAHVTAKRTINPAEKIGHALRAKLLTALEREAQHFEGELASEFQGMFRAAVPGQVITIGGSPSATNAPTYVTTSSK
ncbi:MULTISPECIES: hypothetical protein [unclassified Sphingopyxis]|uniref:hypothetical protein n=1 Tax=unclassified Sphingopyxis TaxID=2614943 RepID=UPI0024AE8505|nr:MULTISPECIES: hypothetical protein [unclassified Sphingopyxis]